MNIRKIISMSVKNLINRKKMTYKTILVISLIYLFFGIFYSYINITKFSINKVLLNNVSMNRLNIYNSESYWDPVIYDDAKANKILNTQGVIEVYDNIFGISFDTKMEFLDKTVQLPLSTTLFLDKGESLPILEINEFKFKTGKESILKYGRLIENEKELLCTERTLELLGIEPNDNILGTVFNITYSGDDIYKANLYEYTLVGIIDDGYYEIEYLQDSNNGPRIYLPDTTISNFNKVMFIWYYLDVYYNSYLIRDDLNKEIINIMGDNITISENERKDLAYKSLEIQLNISQIIFSITSIIFIVGIIINLTYSMYNIIISKGSYYGILISNGIPVNKLWLLIFFELLIVIIISFIIASLLVIPVNIIFTISLSMIFKYVLISGISGIFITLAISLITIIIINRTLPISLLKKS